MEKVTINTPVVVALVHAESFQWVKKVLYAEGCYQSPEDSKGAAYVSESTTIEQALLKLNADGLAQKALDENWQLMKLKVVPTYLPKKAIKASIPAPPVEDVAAPADAPADVLPEPPAEINVDVSDVVGPEPADPVAEDKSWIHDDSDDDVVYEPEAKAAEGDEEVAA